MTVIISSSSLHSRSLPPLYLNSDQQYEYVIKNNGLPEKSAAYDADWLYTVTAVLAGESYEADEYEMGSYFAQTCPAGYRDGGEGGGSGSGSGKSGDNGYQYDVSYTETTRYAKVKGYGYATDRCVCYTDGSGDATVMTKMRRQQY